MYVSGLKHENNVSAVTKLNLAVITFIRAKLAKADQLLLPIHVLATYLGETIKLRCFSSFQIPFLFS